MAALIRSKLPRVFPEFRLGSRTNIKGSLQPSPFLSENSLTNQDSTLITHHFNKNKIYRTISLKMSDKRYIPPHIRAVKNNQQYTGPNSSWLYLGQVHAVNKFPESPTISSLPEKPWGQNNSSSTVETKAPVTFVEKIRDEKYIIPQRRAKNSPPERQWRRNNSNTLESLPNEMIARIIDFIEFRDILAIGSTDTRLFAITSTITLRNGPSPLSILLKLMASKAKISSEKVYFLSLVSHGPQDIRAQKFIYQMLLNKFNDSLEPNSIISMRIYQDGQRLENEAEFFMSGYKELKSLCLSYASLGQSLIDRIKEMKKLRSLYLEKCSLRANRVRFKNRRNSLAQNFVERWQSTLEFSSTSLVNIYIDLGECYRVEECSPEDGCYGYCERCRYEEWLEINLTVNLEYLCLNIGNSRLSQITIDLRKSPKIREM